MVFRCRENCKNRKGTASRFVVAGDCYDDCKTTFGGLRYTWKAFYSDVEDDPKDSDYNKEYEYLPKMTFAGESNHIDYLSYLSCSELFKE